METGQETIVDACLRDGHGGSPTAIRDETGLTDEQRRAVPERAGTSHAVFVAENDAPGGGVAAAMRFFTSAGELPACGHGTVAALALIAERRRAASLEVTITAGGRSFAGRVSRRADGLEASFDPGPIATRPANREELAPALQALGLDHADAGQAHVASVGRARLLIGLGDLPTLAGLDPDAKLLREACDRFGFLGCYVYVQRTRAGRMAARMFAPSIGVPEDIANANSTACLAAVLAGRGGAELAVDMGDSLGCPATILASARATGAGLQVHVGGIAKPRSVSQHQL